MTLILHGTQFWSFLIASLKLLLHLFNSFLLSYFYFQVCLSCLISLWGFQVRVLVSDALNADLFNVCPIQPHFLCKIWLVMESVLVLRYSSLLVNMSCCLMLQMWLWHVLINVCNIYSKTLAGLHSLVPENQFVIGVKDAYFFGCTNFRGGHNILPYSSSYWCLDNPDEAYSI